MAGTKVALAGTTRTPLTALSTDYVPVDTGGTPTKIALPHLTRSLNVKAYGAKGDTRRVTDAVCTGSSTTVTSATGAFTAADVGKVVFGVLSADGSVPVPVGTVVTVNSVTSITVSVAATGSWTGIWLTFGTDDTTAIIAALADAYAAGGTEVFFPKGGYLFNRLLANWSPSARTTVPAIRGDGMYCTTLFMSAAFDDTTAVAFGGAVIHTSLNADSLRISHLKIDCGTIPSGKALLGSTKSVIWDNSDNGQMDFVEIGYGGTLQAVTCAGHQAVYRSLRLYSCETGLTLSQVNSCDVYDIYSGNHTNRSVAVTGVDGVTNGGKQVRFFGGICDESTSRTVDVFGSSTDVCFFGVKMFGGAAGFACRAWGNSTIKLFGCEVVAFSLTLNRNGLEILAGSTVYASGCRFDGTGTGIGITNAGTLYDLGGNTTDTYTGAGAVVANDRKTVGTAVTVANTTMTNLTDLTFTVAAGVRVSGRASFFADDATAGDGIKFDMDGGSATFASFIAQYRLTDGAGEVTVARTTAIATDATVATFTNAGLVEIEFSGVVNAAGTLIPRVAKNSGSTGNVTVSAGSNMVLNGLAN